MIWNRDKQNRLILRKDFQTHDQLEHFLLFVSQLSKKTQQFPKVTYRKLTVTVRVREGMEEIMQALSNYFEKDNRDVDNTTKITTAVLYCDGGSRGNPGPAATGYVILDQSGERIAQGGEYLGTTTNNQAEYKSLVHGLKRALDMGISSLAAYMDSQLVVRQITRQYKVRNQDILPIYKQSQKMIAQLEEFSINHVPRDSNKKADAMVNRLLDQNTIEA